MRQFFFTFGCGGMHKNRDFSVALFSLFASPDFYLFAHFLLCFVVLLAFLLVGNRKLLWQNISVYRPGKGIKENVNNGLEGQSFLQFSENKLEKLLLLSLTRFSPSRSFRTLYKIFSNPIREKSSQEVQRAWLLSAPKCALGSPCKKKCVDSHSRPNNYIFLASWFQMTLAL